MNAERSLFYSHSASGSLANERNTPAGSLVPADSGCFPGEVGPVCGDLGSRIARAKKATSDEGPIGWGSALTPEPYYELAELAEVYLEDSYLLTVTVVPGLVELQLDVVLREGHPEYREPRESEQYCFRRGVLRFEGVEAVAWRMPGETDYGGVDSYRFDGRVHRIAGDIGELTITCDPPQLVLEPDTWSNPPTR
jgi:hypothetical protein